MREKASNVHRMTWGVIDMKYRIRAFKNGECVLTGKSAFKGYDPDGVYPFYLYVWVIQGGGRNIVLDTGPKDLDRLNAMVKHILVEPVTQRPEETTEAIIERAGLHLEDVDYVFITHFHYDHCSNVDLFPKARIVVSRKGFDAAVDPTRTKPIDADRDFIDYLLSVPERVLPVDEGEVLPGVTTFWAGGHTISSQAYVFDTNRGSVVFASDSIFLYRNMEMNIPIGVGRKLDERIEAMRRIRDAADIVVPGHDPEILDRHPGGRVA